MLQRQKGKGRVIDGGVKREKRKQEYGDEEMRRKEEAKNCVMNEDVKSEKGKRNTKTMKH